MRTLKKTKRFLSLAIVITLLMTCVAGSANAAGSASTGKWKSGNLTMEKLNKGEIAQLLVDNPLTLPENVFDVEPSCTAPYATGTVKTEALQAAVNRLNALRSIAGVPAVTLDMGLCENAQYGAVIIGARGALNHRPEKPADMDESFYQKAYQATSSSNLYAGKTLTTAVDGFMNDSDAGNIDCVGHRRWQLNPTMGKVGFGFATSDTSYRKYVVEKVFDKSGAGCNYDFISWPSSGNFPNNLSGFTRNTAWSVTLNPSKFQIPSQSSITVTLTREEDGKCWTFSGNDYTAASSGLYFHIDTANYGVANCIIFRPDGIENYEGIYTVHIDGLKTKSGQQVADFTYQVDFFNTDDYIELGKPDAPADSIENPFVDVEAGSWYYDAVQWAVGREITNGTSKTTFSPDIKCTRAQILTFMYRYLRMPASMMDCTYSFDDVEPLSPYEEPINWAVRQQIAEANRQDVFGANTPCTRAEAVLFLYRMDGSPDVETTMTFSDVPEDAVYAKAVSWAVTHQITNGTGADTFSPDETCTRAQIVTFLNRMARNVYHSVDAATAASHAHSYGWVLLDEPTEAEAGLQRFRCSVCQDEFVHVLPSWSSVPFAETN